MPRKHRKPARTIDGKSLTDALAWYSSRKAVFSGENDIELLRGGDELFPAMCEAIGAARREVWLATYIFYDDEAGRRVFDALCAASRRGVHVHLVIDGFGSKGMREALQERCKGAGVELAVFGPIGRWLDVFKPSQFRRLHQKLCVVDDRVAFVGGINIIDDRLDIRHGHLAAPRLDFAVRVTGPVVRPVRYSASAMWYRAELGKDWLTEIAGVARSPRPVTRARRLLDKVKTPKPEEAYDEDASKGSITQIGLLPPMCAAFVVRDNLRQRRTIERCYIEAIRRARERVDIVCPYFYPGRAFRRVLDKAARRGVQVRLVLQGQLDYKVAGIAARVLYDELISCGVHIFEYMPAFLHAKVAVVDGHWATVGSSNIDPLSLLLNLEANVIVEDAGFVAKLSSEIDAAIAASRPVSLSPDMRRGWLARARRTFVALCARAYLRVAGAGVAEY